MRKLRLFLIACFVVLAFVDGFAAKKRRVKIEVGCLNSIPVEFDGGLCTFYKSLDDVDNDRYMMVNDLAEEACMVINGKLEKFSLVTNTDMVYHYANNDYKLTIKLTDTSIPVKDGDNLTVAFFIIENRNHDKVKLKCYAFCSC